MTMIETNRVEFKQELTRELDIEKEVVSFLNYREGGIIYIGIDDNGKAIGVKDIDGDMLKIKDRIRNGISPSPMGLFDVLVEQVQNVPVIKIFVASGSEKPYYKTSYGLSPRGCFMRVGTAAEPMTTAQIEDIFTHRVRNSLWNIPSPRKKLTFRQLHIYYESKGIELNDHFMENLDLLTDAGEPNYVAYLLADENSMSIKVAKYAGVDRDILVANNEFGFCSLLKATDQVLDKLRVENNVSSEIRYKRRIDTPLWDERAMREIVINAIVHNDYYTNEVPPKFEIFSDRIEITSAGRLPVDMTQEEFFCGISSPRNKELMRVFRDVDLVEALGSGLKRIQKVYKKDIFSFTTNYIRTTIPFHSQIVKNETSYENTLGNANVEIGNVNNLEPTKRQLDIISIISNFGKNGGINGRDGGVNSGITTKEIISKLNISERTIYRELSILKEMKRIRFVGSAKNGYWEILSDNNDVSILENAFGGVKESELTKRQLDIISIIANYGKNGSVNGKNDGVNGRDGGVNSGVSTKEIVSKLNISERTVQRELSILKEMKLIRRVGSDKTGHWEIIK